MLEASQTFSDLLFFWIFALNHWKILEFFIFSVVQLYASTDYAQRFDVWSPEVPRESKSHKDLDYWDLSYLRRLRFASDFICFCKKHHPINDLAQAL